MAAPSFAEPLVQHLTQDLDLSQDMLARVLDLAAQVKRTPQRFAQALAGRYLSLLFEKPSLRTRVTFELAIKQLGGDAVTSVGPVGEREPTKDVARNLDRWTQGIVARVFSQDTVQELAQWAHVPVINALSDLYHPCQALADVQTLRERLGDLEGRRLAWVGDGHDNVCHSLLTAAGRMGMQITVATPAGYEPDPDVVAGAGAVSVVEDPAEAVDGADAVVTDVWTSMGQEAEREQRLADLAPYQVNAELLAHADPEHVVLHCLPAHCGEEITEEILHGPHSAAWDEAENRLHAQKALLAMLLA